MDASMLLRTICIICAFVSAFCCVYGISSFLRRVRARNTSVWNSIGYSFGIPPFNAVANALMKLDVVEHFVENLVELINLKKGVSTNKKAVASTLLGVLLVLGSVISIVANNIIAGIAACALLITVLALRIQSWHEKSEEEMRACVPDSLSTMGECFQAGYSLVQTMQMVSSQTTGKIAQVFGKCANMLQLGSSSSEALKSLREDTTVEELSFVAVALDVQHQTGGSIVSVLGSAQQMVQDKIDLSRSLQVQTAQARLSARVVCLMPFVLAFVLSMVSEGFLAPFFSSVAGVVMLGIALFMEGAGVIMVRKMLKGAMS